MTALPYGTGYPPGAGCDFMPPKEPLTDSQLVRLRRDSLALALAQTVPQLLHAVHALDSVVHPREWQYTYAHQAKRPKGADRDRLQAAVWSAGWPMEAVLRGNPYAITTLGLALTPLVFATGPVPTSIAPPDVPLTLEALHTARMVIAAHEVADKGA